MSAKKILVVEDEAIVVRDICTQLSLMGYGIAGECTTAESALAKVAEEPPDLVLMDIQLAGEMDGVTAAGILRDRYDIPVVFLTSFTGGEVFERAKKMDPFGYILKPFEERELQVVIEMALYKHEMQTRMRLQSQALAVADNLIVITDPKGQVIWANQAFLKKTGYSEEETLGKNISELVKSGRHEPSFYSRMWTTIQQGNVWKGELINRRKDGSTYHEHMTITPMFGPDGQIRHYISIKQDITEQKNLEKMYLRAQRLESIGTLAGGVAHDLNNILSPIIMSADLLLKDSACEDQRELLRMIVESAQRGADIVKQVLSFARTSDGKNVKVQIRHLLSDLTRICRETFPRNIEIFNEVPRDLWQIHADSTQIHQVMMNLLVNARNAMSAGGRLRLTGKNLKLEDSMATADPEVSLPPGSYIQIQVEDTGVGIPPELLEKIFDPFFTTNPAGTGTGLGLSTAQRIVLKHAGDISVVSTPEVGSTFTVTLPASEENIPPTAEEPFSVPEKGRKERILVVDDEESVRWMLRSTLEKLNYQVTLACDGQDAINCLSGKETHFDLVMLDLVMPVLDGRETLKRMKVSHPDLPVVVMSGMSDALRETEITETATAILRKPFNIQDLSEILRELLEKRAQ